MFDTLAGSTNALVEPGRVVAPQARAAQIDEAIREKAALVAVTEAQILELVAERETLNLDHGGWSSPAAWLSATAGYSPAIARKQVEVAGKLDELPVIKDAFSSGEVSFSEIKEIVPIATPETEEVLLNIARHAPVATTQRFARVYGRARRESSEGLQEKLRRREIRRGFQDDGTYRLSAHLMGDEGALVDRVLDQTLEGLKAEQTEGVGDGSAGYQVMVADAFMEMVRSALEHGLPEDNSPNPIVMQVDIETLAGLQGEVANLERRIGIPKETVERYMCDCSMKSVLERDGDPLHVGRRYRSINNSMRIALQTRDECCRWPGCVRTRALQAHHLWAWIEGGLTNIEDLRLYCRFHHVLLHEGGFKVVLESDGSLTHLRPNGSLVYESRSRLQSTINVEKIACERGVDGTTRGQLVPEKLDHRYAAGVVADRDKLWGRRAEATNANDTDTPVSDPPALPATSRGP